MPNSIGTHTPYFGGGSEPSVKTSVKSPSGDSGHSVLVSALRELSSRNTTCFTHMCLSFAPSQGLQAVESASLVAGRLCTHPHFLLALSLVVAVYIKESWWPTEDVLRTSDPAREGLMKVRWCRRK